MNIKTTYHEFNQAINSGDLLRIQHAISDCDIDRKAIQNEIERLKRSLYDCREYKEKLGDKAFQLRVKSTNITA